MLEKTVFAFGSGRSGTTLLAKLIDSSPEILYRHEPDKTLPNSKIPFLPDPDQYEQLLGASRNYLEQLIQQRSVRVSGKRPIFDKEFRSPAGTKLLQMVSPIWAMADKAGFTISLPDLIRSDDYHYLIKSVSSVCRAPLFAKAAPGMKFVHIVRHPGGVIASQLKGIEQGVMQREAYVRSVARMSNARRFPISAEQIQASGFEQQIAYTWMMQNDKSERELNGNPSYLLVSYEDLCVNMRERMAEICRFIGIEFDPQMAAFINAISRTEKDSGYFSVFKNPLGSIDKWEQALAPETTERIVAMVEQSEVGRFVLERYAAVKERLQ